ncbi:MAG: Hpt domain-containing protein, partial [Gammaproteobacteria bacterium]|nr:Hpt domain-containing protein [Gammaproteobacteria bacterium]
MSIDMEQFHQVFFEESFEGLDVMETGLLNLDNGEADSEEINSIFRAAHSIKGGSGTFGFQNIADFTHIMETLLDEVRDGVRELTREGINILLKSVDCLRMMMTAASDGGDVDEAEVKQNYTALEQILNGTAASVPSAKKTKIADVSDQSAESSADKSVSGWRVSFAPHKNFMHFGNDPARILRELAKLGELTGRVDTSKVPDFANLNPEDMYLSWDVEIKGNMSKEDINEVFSWVEDESDIAISTLSEAAASAVKAVQKVVTSVPQATASADTKTADKKEKSSAAASSSIRVGIDKIDDLINMVGELVITQSMLSML